jgi:hypothetical protein
MDEQTSGYRCIGALKLLRPIAAIVATESATESSAYSEFYVSVNTSRPYALTTAPGCTALIF